MGCLCVEGASLCKSVTNLVFEEGIPHPKEAFDIFEGLGDTVGQAECLNCPAWLLREDRQLDAAEVAASHAMTLLPDVH